MTENQFWKLVEARSPKRKKDDRAPEELNTQHVQNLLLQLATMKPADIESFQN
jgi:hypothetical protein